MHLRCDRLLALALLSFVPACAEDLGIDRYGWACTRSEQCGQGNVCGAAGVCVSGTGWSGEEDAGNKPDWTGPAGHCGNATDTGAIDACTADVVAACGLTCLGEDTGAIDTCAADCVAHDYAELSKACAGCYTGTVECAVDRCLPDCLNYDSLPCYECLESAGCHPEFYMCSGLTREFVQALGACPRS